VGDELATSGCGPSRQVDPRPTHSTGSQLAPATPTPTMPKKSGNAPRAARGRRGGGGRGRGRGGHGSHRVAAQNASLYIGDERPDSAVDDVRADEGESGSESGGSSSGRDGGPVEGAFLRCCVAVFI
jgi:hypothetical protein